MDIKAFLQSGVIESFCLGVSSQEEILLVNTMRDLYPEVNDEIEKVLQSLAGKSVLQLSKVKQSVLRTVYRSESESGKHRQYLPLMDEVADTAVFRAFAEENNIGDAPEPYEIGYMLPLPSTAEITNYAAWLRSEMPEEVHEGVNEYIFILRGTCTMIIEGEERNYTAGQLMLIPPGVRHRAVVTSYEPMLALVQRQLIMA